MTSDTMHTPGPWMRPSGNGAKDGFPRWDVLAKDGDYAVSVARVLHFEDMRRDERMANAALIARAPDLLAENARLKAENERMREALGPFSEYAKGYQRVLGDWWPVRDKEDDPILSIAADNRVEAPTLGDCFRARKALTGEPLPFESAALAAGE